MKFTGAFATDLVVIASVLGLVVIIWNAAQLITYLANQ